MKTVAIAGASGFVGRLLVERLRPSFRVLALGRGGDAVAPTNVEWRRTDLYSAGSSRDALAGADVAVYLVHSMMPARGLFQGTFHDTDLLLADNFAKGCARSGVKQIIYLGGLVPEHGYLSPHLQSRRDVEGVLAASGIPVTVLRAGMIVGPGGSSFEILRSLVRKLPVMVLPRWTQSPTQAVFIDDAVEALARAAIDPAFLGQTLNLVNGESLTYERLLREMAAALNLRRPMIRVPLTSTGFSKLWVRLFGNASHELVSPLIDSLLCELPQLPPGPLIAPLIRYPTFSGMLADCLGRSALPAPVPTERPTRALAVRNVRSVQRLPSLPLRDAAWIAQEYTQWLPELFRAMIRVRILGPRVEFVMRPLRAPLLVLEYIPDPLDTERTKLHIVGGLLTRTTTTGWLEFRQIDHKQYTLAAVHGFVPSLPWPIYRLTQAPIHRAVMEAFGRHLAAGRGAGKA